MLRGIVRFHFAAATLLVAAGAAGCIRAVLQRRAAAARRHAIFVLARAADAERARQRQELVNLAHRIDGALANRRWGEAIELLRDADRLVETYHYRAWIE